MIEPVIKKHALTMPETALRWLRHHSALDMRSTLSPPDGVIIGVSNLAQLQSNLHDIEKGPLPDEVVGALDKAWLITKPTAANYWHFDLEYTYHTQEARFGQTRLA